MCYGLIEYIVVDCMNDISVEGRKMQTKRITVNTYLKEKKRGFWHNGGNLAPKFIITY